jgi:cytochrome P450
LGKRAELSYQDLIELKYCSAVFKEALRLWPPVSFLSRVCKQKWEIDGYEIPKGTILYMSSYANARLEKYFKDAYEFKPERFIKDKESEIGFEYFFVISVLV